MVATDAVLTKVQANRLASVAHDGLARAINPVHTMSDGDTLFALATGRVPLEGDAPGMTVLGAMAAEVVALATVRAVRAARSVRIGEQPLPGRRRPGLSRLGRGHTACFVTSRGRKAQKMPLPRRGVPSLVPTFRMPQDHHACSCCRSAT